MSKVYIVCVWKRDYLLSHTKINIDSATTKHTFQNVITIVLINVIRTLLRSSPCILKNICVSSQVEIFSTLEKANIYVETYQKKLEKERNIHMYGYYRRKWSVGQISVEKYRGKGEQIFFSSIMIFFFVRMNLKIDRTLSLTKMWIDNENRAKFWFTIRSYDISKYCQLQGLTRR